MEFFVREWIATAFIPMLFHCVLVGRLPLPLGVAAREDSTATFGLSTWPVVTIGPGAITATERRSTTQGKRPARRLPAGIGARRGVTPGVVRVNDLVDSPGGLDSATAFSVYSGYVAYVT